MKKKDDGLSIKSSDLLKGSVDRCVSWYLMASYLYYREDLSLISDGLFDSICDKILGEWKTIKHPHKKYITREGLKAGSGFYIKKYPTITIVSAHQVYQIIQKRKSK